MDWLPAQLALVGLLALTVTATPGCSRNGLEPARPDAGQPRPTLDAAHVDHDGPAGSDGTTMADGCTNDCRVDGCAECGGLCPGCPPVGHAVCGDGRLAADERCDDGNDEPGDGCSADCTTVETGFRCRVPSKRCMAICGDGSVKGGETCDDGNSTSGDGCSSVCRIEPDPMPPVCGDGNTTPDEECDCGDGSGTRPDTCLGPNDDTAYGDCTTTCTWGSFCGDGIVNGPEECDLGTLNGRREGPAGCTVGCRTPHYCGDGIVDTSLGEQCDLGDWNGQRLDLDRNPSDSPDAFIWCQTDCTLPYPGVMPHPAPTTP